MGRDQGPGPRPASGSLLGGATAPPSPTTCVSLFSLSPWNLTPTDTRRTTKPNANPSLRCSLIGILLIEGLLCTGARYRTCKAEHPVICPESGTSGCSHVAAPGGELGRREPAGFLEEVPVASGCGWAALGEQPDLWHVGGKAQRGLRGAEGLLGGSREQWALAGEGDGCRGEGLEGGSGGNTSAWLAPGGRGRVLAGGCAEHFLENLAGAGQVSEPQKPVGGLWSRPQTVITRFMKTYQRAQLSDDRWGCRSARNTGAFSSDPTNSFFCLFLKIFIYLFMRDPGRGRSRLHAGCPMWDSIPGPQGHALGCRWC